MPLLKTCFPVQTPPPFLSLKARNASVARLPPLLYLNDWVGSCCSLPWIFQPPKTPASTLLSVLRSDTKHDSCARLCSACQGSGLSPHGPPAGSRHSTDGQVTLWDSHQQGLRKGSGSRGALLTRPGTVSRDVLSGRPRSLVWCGFAGKRLLTEGSRGFPQLV